MNINLNMHTDISEVLGIGIRKALEFKHVDSFTQEEFATFWEHLSKDEEFINAYNNIIKIDNK